MPNILTLTRQRVLNDMIKSTQPVGRWKVIIVDPRSVRILNASCRMHEVLEENVTLVEDITKKRSPYHSIEAIYFITPTPENINILIDDFTRSPKPSYAAAHIYCTAALPDKLFGKLKNSISQHIKTLKEMLIDFIPYEPQVYTFDTPTSLFALFNPPSPSLLALEMDMLSKRLLSVLATLGEYPHIRYYDPLGQSSTGGLPLAGRFAQVVQAELDNLCRIDDQFPPVSTYRRAVLIIVDRSLDFIAPLNHEFTYQAMMNDLLVMEGGKYVYKAEGGVSTDASAAHVTAQLDDNDPIWTMLRHWHYAEAAEYIRNSFNIFLSENKAAVSTLGAKEGTNIGSMENLKQMKDTLSSLPEFQEMKAKFSVHINICQECKSLFERRKLSLVASVEQDMATGETSDGRAPKNIFMDLVAALDSKDVISVDKIRMLMMYITSQGGIQDGDRRRLLDYAKLTIEESQAITNMHYFGVRLSAPAIPEKKKEMGRYTYYGRKNDKKKNKHSDEDVPYDLSRYSPILRTVVEDQILNKLDTTIFPWIKEPPMDEMLPPSASRIKGSTQSGGILGSITGQSNIIGGGATSLRTTRASWSKKAKGHITMNPVYCGSNPTSPTTQEVNIEDDLRKNGPRVVVFMLGGMSFSEMRTVYELQKKYERECFIVQFVEALKEIHKPDAMVSFGSKSTPKNEIAIPSNPIVTGIKDDKKKAGDKLKGMFKTAK
ncbi:vacuolar sorting protein VPS33/slp1 [Nowakowskiella sp. JEL0078]|nr:vacuolar sorting protein VPS33/slp1 [Nowakowskiella sp. JEL0078]